MNYDDYSEIFENNDTTFDFLRNNQLIDNKVICPYCGDKLGMYLYKFKQCKSGYRWKCQKCHRTQSVYKGSIFQDAKLSHGIILKILYFWSHNYPGNRTSFETKVSEHSISHVFRQCKGSCHNNLSSDNQGKVGGPGKVIEIDETMFSKRKNHAGRKLNSQWIFGGIIREDNEIFLDPIPNRKAKTLYNSILKHVNFGTTIMSDMWAGYKIIDEQPFPQPYPHQMVNHSKNFIDPSTGANTQKCERLWREFKEKKRSSRGVPRSSVDFYCSEFQWRQTLKEKKGDCFKAICQILSETCFEN